MRAFLFLVASMTCVFLSACWVPNGRRASPKRAPNIKIGDKTYRVRLVFEDDFADLDHWLLETTGRVKASENQLVWECEGGVGTLWCRKFFEGPTIVEYDVTTVAGANNINFFFYARNQPRGLLETTDERDGTYSEYHVFQNYIITYLTTDEGQWRVRFRKNPGFNLLSETFVDRPVTQPQKQHITHVFEADGAMSLYADQRLLHTYRDRDNPYRSGYHGFRTWNSVLRYSNFRVYRILDE